ncbi:MAG TPA: hypothetical protein VFK06_19975, partial [Candidatus Angelobacter sp.]|nr:hypothetical protein [Candidatus Angelobacter sp.]
EPRLKTGQARSTRQTTRLRLKFGFFVLNKTSVSATVQLRPTGGPASWSILGGRRQLEDR